MYTGNSSSSITSTSTTSADLLLSGEYEVFLNFCGKDTRNGFTDFLFTYLQGAGVHTFRDDNELRVGEEIGPELLKAIKNSKISIPIFSKNYASSKWCLLELTQMVECHVEAPREKMIFPIFYDVDPHDVRHQSGSYKKAFRQHEKKKRLEVKTVQGWKDALTKVGQLKGLELKKETGGREGELVKLTVEKCLQFLKKNYPHVPTNLVGMDNHIINLKGLLEVGSDEVRIVGIHGMGGLGKTTMAKIIYNQLCEHFQGHCFLENVRENSRPHGQIVNLQNQLISKIQNKEVSKFSDFNEGSDRIKEVVRGKKVLIVLDDVDDNFEVEMLMGKESWFGVRSRIIITTRNKSVLDAINWACQRKDLLYVYASYQPDFMDDQHSLQLFSKYAFRRDSPNEEYNILSKEVVSIAAGLPLVLVVLGSTFFGVERKDLWEENLRKLRKIPHKEIINKLRFSFEALEYEHKQIFLDMACLFIGMDVTIPSYMWEDCEFYPEGGIWILINRSLITIGDDNKLKMHDQLRDLGRQIVREESLLGKPSRLWREEEVTDILETREVTSSVDALFLPVFLPSESPSLVPSFHNLPNLRYLEMKGQDIEGDFKLLFKNLRWLTATCSSNSTPTNLHMKNLVILNLSRSGFTHDWEGWNQLKMSKKLKLLDLSVCKNLRVLPHLSTFASLEILKLGDCDSLCRLDGLEQLKALKYLDASGCDHLETLPSLSNLTNLVELHLDHCEKLVEIKGLEKLESLQVLDITGCESLKRLPDFSNLQRLKTFKAKWCGDLIVIGGLDKLNSLEHLDLKYSSLKGVLDMSNLFNLKTIVAPTIDVTNFSNLEKLNRLEITFSDNLIEFQGLDGLVSLEHMKICGGSIRRLPNLSRVKILHIKDCAELVEIQDLGGLESLEQLKISRCSSIKILVCSSKIRKLTYFDCSSCENLIEIQGLDRLESLKFFCISNCPSLKRLPNIPNHGMLKRINVEWCDKLHDVEGLEVIESLESLEISHCWKLREIPNLRGLKNLKTLNIRSLKDLAGIDGLEQLKSLEYLKIVECNLIEALPNVSNLQKLTYVDVSDCVKLTAINGLEELKSLEWLLMSGCKSIESLPDFSIHEKLWRLDVSGCVKLTEIRGLEELKSLEVVRR